MSDRYRNNNPFCGEEKNCLDGACAAAPRRGRRASCGVRYNNNRCNDVKIGYKCGKCKCDNGDYDNGIYDNGIYDNGIVDNDENDNGIMEDEGILELIPDGEFVDERRAHVYPNTHLIHVLLDLDFGPAGIVPTMAMCEGMINRYRDQAEAFACLLKKIDCVLRKYALEDVRLVRCLGGGRELCHNRYRRNHCHKRYHPIICEDPRMLQRSIEHAEATLIHQFEILINHVRAILCGEDNKCITPFLRRLLHDLLCIEEALHDFRDNYCVRGKGLKCALV